MRTEGIFLNSNSTMDSMVSIISSPGHSWNFSFRRNFNNNKFVRLFFRRIMINMQNTLQKVGLQRHFALLCLIWDPPLIASVYPRSETSTPCVSVDQLFAEYYLCLAFYFFCRKDLLDWVLLCCYTSDEFGWVIIF